MSVELFFRVVLLPGGTQAFDRHGLFSDNSERELADDRNFSSWRLTAGGVFALWSNDLPDEAFLSRLASQFAVARAEKVVFHNPLLDEDCVQTVYIAIRG